MRILANKTNLYNNLDFLQQSTEEENNLEGVGFNVAITKDNQFVIFSPVSDNQTTIQTITSKNLNELEHLDLLTLKDTLDFYQNKKSKLKIFLNLLPSTIPITSEKSLLALKGINENYAKNLLDIIRSYQTLNLYLGSVNASLIELLKVQNISWKTGIVLFGGNMNYIDVDFYVFGTGLLSEEIFNQQLELKKEVILYLGTASDLSTTYEFFKGEKSTALAHSIFDQIMFLNDYPDLFLKIFSN